MMEDPTGVGKALESVSQLTKELREFISKLLGPAGEEIGELLRDKVKFLRFKNALRTFQQAEQLLRDNGISPKLVPLKMLIPILEGCSIEEDDNNLVSKWSGLLASAAAGDQVHPSYPKILAELTPVEARMLDTMYQRFIENEPNDYHASFIMKELYEQVGLPLQHFTIAVVNIHRLGLCDMPTETGGIDLGLVTSPVFAVPAKLTPLGHDFVQVCRGPRAIATKNTTDHDETDAQENKS